MLILLTHQFSNLLQEILDSKPSIFLQTIQKNGLTNERTEKLETDTTLLKCRFLPSAKDAVIFFGPVRESL